MARPLWLFLCYSLLGFLLEVTFVRLTGTGDRARKELLFLPLCPVYGLGAAAVLSAAPLAQGRPLLLYLVGCAAATAVEYVYDLCCDRLLHVRFWDYRHLSANLNGRICLPFSLCWGALAVLVVQRIHPGLETLLPLFPQWAAVPAALILAADLAATLVVLRRTGNAGNLRWYRRLPLFKGAAAPPASPEWSSGEAIRRPSPPTGIG